MMRNNRIFLVNDYEEEPVTTLDQLESQWTDLSECWIAEETIDYYQYLRQLRKTERGLRGVNTA